MSAFCKLYLTQSNLVNKVINAITRFVAGKNEAIFLLKKSRWNSQFEVKAY